MSGAWAARPAPGRSAAAASKASTGLKQNRRMGSNNGGRDFGRKNRLAGGPASGEIAGMNTPEDGRWIAIVTRDTGADGRFVYAVRTTGIYCRPTCPSRRAKRENVETF